MTKGESAKRRGVIRVLADDGHTVLFSGHLTVPPEVRASHFVSAEDGLYYSSLTKGYYKYWGRAIEATLEKMKEKEQSK